MFEKMKRREEREKACLIQKRCKESVHVNVSLQVKNGDRRGRSPDRAWKKTNRCSRSKNRCVVQCVVARSNYWRATCLIDRSLVRWDNELWLNKAKIWIQQKSLTTLLGVLVSSHIVARAGPPGQVQTARQHRICRRSACRRSRVYRTRCRKRNLGCK